MTLRKFCWVAVVALALVGAAATAKPLDRIEPSKSQTETIRDILDKLQSRHYRELRLDDQLSSRYLDKYLDLIDPSRMFFYSKDIRSFEKHRQKFDDYFRTGNLKPAYEVYNTYRSRLASRLESVLEMLNDETVKFDFTVDDEVLLERDKEPWPSSLAEADKLWYKRVKLSLLNLKIAGKTVEEAKETLQLRFKRQLKRVEQQNAVDVFETIANALTLLYDPHTNYWTPRASENFNINMRLSLEGIGAMLQIEDEFTKVISLVPGGPADKGGQLKPADRILSVAQGDEGGFVDVVGWRLDEVVDLIRGPRNTIVKLEVQSPEAKPGLTRTVRIARDRVKLEDQAAQSEVFEIKDGDASFKVGVIDLPTFYVDFDALRQRKADYKSASSDVAQLVREMMRDKVDGIILDLRNNGGGSLQEAVNLVDLFIDQGPVVQIRSPDNRINRHNRSRFKALYDGPLVVLVNRLSASASEIFAGAIQDYNRGIIVGAQTFGKGTVQSVNPLVEGGLKITESKFYRVSGDSTQHRGVIPDIEIPFLIDPDEVGESSYENALPWDQIRPVPHIDYYDFASILPGIKTAHAKRATNDPDYRFLLDQIEVMERNKARKTISLNEKRRLDEKDRLEVEAMEIENKRRTAKGQTPYKTLAEYRKSETPDESSEEEPVIEKKKIDFDDDTVLSESGSILVDLIQMQTRLPRQRQAYAHQ